MNKYVISPLDSNKTILQQLTEIAKYLHDNGIYKIYSFNGNYDNAVDVYNLSSISNLGDDELTSGDVIVFNNCYYGQITSVGDDTFTITSATSFKGAQGDTGASGQDGQDGEDGRGITSITKTSTSGLQDTYTITYSDGTTSTFVITNGAQGEQGETGLVGLECFKLETTQPVVNNTIQVALNYFNRTPVANERVNVYVLLSNGDFYITTCEISAVDSSYATLTYKIIPTATNIKGATGANGADGRGIVSISKTSTSGNVDTYTITYTDNTTSTFTITNGSASIQTYSSSANSDVISFITTNFDKIKSIRIYLAGTDLASLTARSWFIKTDGSIAFNSNDTYSYHVGFQNGSGTIEFIPNVKETVGNFRIFSATNNLGNNMKEEMYLYIDAGTSIKMILRAETFSTNPDSNGYYTYKKYFSNQNITSGTITFNIDYIA